MLLWAFFVLWCAILGVVATLVGAGFEILHFRWTLLKGAFKFSLLHLLSGVLAISFALGLNTLQKEFALSHDAPFAALLLVSFALVLGAFAIAHDFRGRRSGSDSGKTALEAYRTRQTCEAVATEPAVEQPEADEVAKPSRRKWWLRRFPNRFRSISHRDGQTTRAAGYYIPD